MKKLFILMLLSIALVGCSSRSVQDKAQEIDYRFKVNSTSNIAGNRYVAVLEDKETGCRYIYAYAANNSVGTALTPLLTEKGAPVCGSDKGE
ncbi:DUF6440 family protein [Paenibacillus sp. NPDC057886]|uniref:DUF6440 family protein n=1 Tax=Paenibacillus sp. NPDC057886 TaxID=3346270 RepID=UPI0036B83585